MLNLKNLDKVVSLHTFVIVGVISWSAMLLTLYLWAESSEQKNMSENIRLKAESLAKHSNSLRDWVGAHGGIYVEVDENIQPNPLLVNVPERDIETLSGRKLTLLNSPSLLREILSAFENDGGDRLKLVSNQPMNPSNLPNSWEEMALEKLESGASKVEAFITEDDQNYFRLMYPMIKKPKCLNCHFNLIDNPQKIVGGLSVRVDKGPYDKLSYEVLRKIEMGYASVWLIGLLALIAFDYKGAKMLREIEFSATHDGLTKLKNRKEIERLINLECERAERYGDRLAVMMLDIDFFKKVNDNYGHQSGDETLRVVAKTIEKTIRKVDTVGRYGGEEFLILVPGNKSEYESESLAQRLNQAIKDVEIELNDGKKLSVTVSIGVSQYSAENNTPAKLIKGADDALYKAKEEGRDCIRFEGK